MNIKYFRSSDIRLYAVLEDLVHEHENVNSSYYEGFVTISGVPEAHIIKKSTLELCEEVSEAEARLINPAFYYHISMFVTDRKFKTVIQARDVTVGMVVHEDEMGEGFHQVTEVVVGDRYVDDGYIMVATKELDLAHFKWFEPVERIVHAALVA